MRKYTKEAMYYDVVGDRRVQCKLCPHMCTILEGHRGLCGVRENIGGKLYTLNYALVSSFAIDPIEKKPLFHFYPGAPIISISTVGCNFKCPWCQNWSISQAKPEDVYYHDYIPPESLRDLINKYKVPFLAFTYNEPIIWYEYVLDVVKLIKKDGIKVVLVTNGHINLDPLDELIPYIDAVNVDIKAFNPNTYLKYIRGKLEGVLQATEELKAKGVHVETTYLVIPGLNDSVDEFRRMVRWHLDTLGAETPLHISRFFPHYKFMDKIPTPIETLEKLWKVAKEEGILYAYVGNLPGHKGENTYCPSCGKPVIRRIGFEILSWRLDNENKCEYCGHRIAITGHRWKGRSTWL